MKKLLCVLLAALMLLGSVSAWAEQADLPEEADTELQTITYDYDELTVGTTTPFKGCFFTSLWGNVVSDLDVRLLIHGYNLVEWRSEDGAFAVDPSVVSGIVVTENAAGDRTYTLTLYDDLYYNDGTPITAWDYAFTVLFSIAPQVGELGAAVKDMSYLLGCSEYLSGQSDALAGLRVYNDYTFAFTVRGDYLPFFYEMALLDCVPSPIQVIAPGCRVADDGSGVYIANIDPDVAEPLFTAELLAETLLNEETGYLSHPGVTSGPYSLVAYDGDQADFELNELYKGNSSGETPTIRRIYFRTVDNETSLDQLASGEITLLNKCAAGDVVTNGVRLVAQTGTFAMANYTRNGMGFVSFCCEQTPVSSQNVRQAIALCLDKEAFLRGVVGNYGLRADGYYGMGQWMYQVLNGTLAYPVAMPDAAAPQQEHDDYDAAIAQWEELTMDDIPVYDLDVDAAVQLLVQDGWTLNEQGESYVAGQDEVRCKLIDGELVPLRLTMLCPAGNTVPDCIDEALGQYMNQVGMALTLQVKPMQDVTAAFYRQADRDCHMIFMASNFDTVFEPSLHFMPDGDAVNPYNFTAINDAALYELLVDMRRTPSDEAIDYCRKWIDFQTRFQTVVPAIPVYTGVYFDFYPRVLHNYNVGASVSWSQAIVGAYLSDAGDAEEEEAQLEPADEALEFEE